MASRALARPTPAYAPKRIADAVQQQQAPPAPIGKSRSKKGKSKHAAHSHEWNCNDLLDMTKAKKRKYYWEVTGSLQDMSGSQYKEAPLTTAQAVMFRGPQDPPGSERKGDPTRAILLGGRLLMIVNRFPVAITLSSDTLRSNTYGASRGDVLERGLFIIPANHTVNFTGDDGSFLLPHPSLMSEVVRRFAKDTHRDLLGECTFVADSNNYLVPQESPIMHIIERNEEVIRKSWPEFSVRRLQLIDGKYLLPAVYVQEACEVFENAIKPRMPHVDMTRLKLRINRHGADWLDPIVSTTDQRLNQSLLTAHGSFSAVVEFTYRLPVST